ncbi:MAG: hypothetical protein J6X18_05195 [Bacteroidales bacterium]|nr:hypothetical protein [Bacteroidales bacterium]
MNGLTNEFLNLKTVYFIDKRTKHVVQTCQVFVEEPLEVIFCKDRKNKQRYLMVRTKGSDPFDITKRQLFETRFCQYDGVVVQIK